MYLIRYTLVSTNTIDIFGGGKDYKNYTSTLKHSVVILVIRFDAYDIVDSL